MTHSPISEVDKYIDRRWGTMMNFAWAAFGVSIITWLVFLVSFAVWANNRSRDRGIWPLGSLIVSVMLTVAWMWIWRSFFHGLWFYVFYANAGLWLVWLICAFFSAKLGAVVALYSGVKKYGAITATVIFTITAFGWGITYGTGYVGWTKNAIYHSVQYEELSELPTTISTHYLPQIVAETYAVNKLQEPTVAIGKAKQIVISGEVLWQVPRNLNGFWNKQKGNSDGFGVIDSYGNVAWARQEMKYGEGMYASDSIMWKLHEHRYWSKITNIYYVLTDQGVVAVAPYLDYSLKFPVMVPHFGGVLLVHSSGEIEDLKPAEAMVHPSLQGVRIFPEELTLKYVDAYQLKNGFKNYYFTHQDQIERVIVSPYGSYYGKEMPYLLETVSGQKWFIATVPWGAKGSYKLFYVDAITGRISFYSTGRDNGSIGPKKALGYIKTAYPQLEWLDMYVLEPRPLTRDGVLYWLYTVTTEDFAGVVDTVLVNSQTSEMLSFGNDKETLDRFLAGEDTGRVITIQDTFHNLPVNPKSD